MIEKILRPEKPQPFLLLALFFIAFTTNLYGQNIKSWQSIIYATDTWSYFEGTSQPPANWSLISIDDSNWKSGKGGFGFGDNDDNTVVSQMPSIFIRRKFNLQKIDNIGGLIFHIDYDDGFVAYLNGVEIARNGLSGNPPAYNTYATINHEAVLYTGGTPEAFVIETNVFKSLLKTGDNVLAIQVHNNSATSSDMSALPFLTAGITDNSTSFGIPPDWFIINASFTSSDIPIVIIETENGAAIVDEPKTKATLKIINNGPGIRNSISDNPNDYNGPIGIEIRGSYSASLPQKPYGFETRDLSGANANVKLLGMPKENDWILLANYNDKSFMRNSLAFHWFEKMGHWAPRTRACEVLINGKYQGIYLLTEKIKQDKNRVDVASLDTNDNAGDSLTGGYLFKIDYTDDGYWTSSYPPIDRSWGQVNFVYHDPPMAELTNQQKQYLKNCVGAFETVLRSPEYDRPDVGYRAYIDVNSFIDYMIIGEVSRNVDAYKKSRFLYKERDSRGGLIGSGPVWDMDWSMKNMWDCDFLSTTDGSGWAYKINDCNVSPVPPGWEVKLLEDQLFADQFYTRYTNLRKTILSNEYIEHYADSVKNLLMEAQTRHYTTWDILGKGVGAPEKDAIPSTYEGEVAKLVAWLRVRLSWLDKNIKGNYLDKSEQVVQNNFLRVFPNPASHFVVVESDLNISEIMLFGAGGNLIRKIDAYNRFSVEAGIDDLPKGSYIVKVKRVNGSELSSHLIINTK